MKFISISIIFLMSVLLVIIGSSITLIPQVYADKDVIRSFNMTEHENTKYLNKNDDYCSTSTCLIQRANELFDKVKTDAYWNDIKANDYLNELDKQVKKLNRID